MWSREYQCPHDYDFNQGTLTTPCAYMQGVLIEQHCRRVAMLHAAKTTVATFNIQHSTLPERLLKLLAMGKTSWSFPEHRRKDSGGTSGSLEPAKPAAVASRG